MQAWECQELSQGAGVRKSRSKLGMDAWKPEGGGSPCLIGGGISRGCGETGHPNASTEPEHGRDGGACAEWGWICGPGSSLVLLLPTARDHLAWVSCIPHGTTQLPSDVGRVSRIFGDRDSLQHHCPSTPGA